jgi:hypothetical protein
MFMLDAHDWNIGREGISNDTSDTTSDTSPGSTRSWRES